MTTTIRLILLFLICIQITAFGQVEKKGFTKKEISKKLTKATLKSIENDSISDFLKGFAKAVEKGSFENLKIALPQGYYKEYIAGHDVTEKDCDANPEQQTLFLKRSLYVYVGEDRFYGEYMNEFYEIEDWTTIKKVHFTKFDYKPSVDYGHYNVVDYWVIKTVFISENGDYYLATLICRIDEKTKKVVFYRAH